MEPDELPDSSSSADTVSEDGDLFAEELVEDGGENEMILVRLSEV